MYVIRTTVQIHYPRSNAHNLLVHSIETRDSSINELHYVCCSQPSGRLGGGRRATHGALTVMLSALRSELSSGCLLLRIGARLECALHCMLEPKFIFNLGSCPRFKLRFPGASPTWTKYKQIMNSHLNKVWTKLEFVNRVWTKLDQHRIKFWICW